MCTGFTIKSNDLLFAYNLDINPNVWDYKLVMNKDIFTISIKAGRTIYYTHGVNSKGNFAILPYMNDNNPFVKLHGIKRIDLLVNSYLRNKLSYETLEEIAFNQAISNVKFGSMHSLFSNIDGKTLLIEPGLKPKRIEKFGVISNYPLLKECNDDNPFYGKDRYNIVYERLKNSNNDFDYNEAICLLKEVSQTGSFATRVSFVYSRNNNCVYYILNNDGIVRIHNF